MPNNFLVPETKVDANGSGPALELGVSAGKPVLLSLGITKIAEQESLDVAIWGSADGQEWGAAPVAAFTQKFYAGVYAMLVDLGKHPEVQQLQARWKVARWGVGPAQPVFTFYVFAEPAPASVAA